MTTSQNGREMIESFEGCALTAYQDGRGIWTIGFGHVDPAVVVAGLTCTQGEADAWMAFDLHAAESAINRLVTVPLDQNQFDACVSLCYNIGQGNFQTSTVCRKLNMGDTEGAADAFLMWDKINGEVSQGLVNRRTAERLLFITPNAV